MKSAETPEPPAQRKLAEALLSDPADVARELATLDEVASQREAAERRAEQQARQALEKAREELDGAEYVRLGTLSLVLAHGFATQAGESLRMLVDQALGLGINLRRAAPPHLPIGDREPQPFELVLGMLWWEDANRLLGHMAPNADGFRLAGPRAAALAVAPAPVALAALTPAEALRPHRATSSRHAMTGPIEAARRAVLSQGGNALDAAEVWPVLQRSAKEEPPMAPMLGLGAGGTIRYSVGSGEGEYTMAKLRKMLGRKRRS